MSGCDSRGENRLGEDGASRGENRLGEDGASRGENRLGEEVAGMDPELVRHIYRQIALLARHQNSLSLQHCVPQDREEEEEPEEPIKILQLQDPPKPKVKRQLSADNSPPDKASRPTATDQIDGTAPTTTTNSATTAATTSLLAISDVCGVSLSLPPAETHSVSSPTFCPAPRSPLWRAGPASVERGGRGQTQDAKKHKSQHVLSASPSSAPSSPATKHSLPVLQIPGDVQQHNRWTAGDSHISPRRGQHSPGFPCAPADHNRWTGNGARSPRRGPHSPTSPTSPAKHNRWTRECISPRRGPHSPCSPRSTSSPANHNRWTGHDCQLSSPRSGQQHSTRSFQNNEGCPSPQSLLTPPRRFSFSSPRGDKQPFLRTLQSLQPSVASPPQGRGQAARSSLLQVPSPRELNQVSPKSSNLAVPSQGEGRQSSFNSVVPVLLGSFEGHSSRTGNQISPKSSTLFGPSSGEGGRSSLNNVAPVVLRPCEGHSTRKSSDLAVPSPGESSLNNVVPVVLGSFEGQTCHRIPRGDRQPERSQTKPTNPPPGLSQSHEDDVVHLFPAHVDPRAGHEEHLVDRSHLRTQDTLPTPAEPEEYSDVRSHLRTQDTLLLRTQDTLPTPAEHEEHSDVRSHRRSQDTLLLRTQDMLPSPVEHEEHSDVRSHLRTQDTLLLRTQDMLPTPAEHEEHSDVRSHMRTQDTLLLRTQDTLPTPAEHEEHSDVRSHMSTQETLPTRPEHEEHSDVHSHLRTQETLPTRPEHEEHSGFNPPDSPKPQNTLPTRAERGDREDEQQSLNNEAPPMSPDKGAPETHAVSPQRQSARQDRKTQVLDKQTLDTDPSLQTLDSKSSRGFLAAGNHPRVVNPDVLFSDTRQTIADHDTRLNAPEHHLEKGERSDAVPRASQHPNRQETIQTRQEEDASRDNGERSDALSRASQHPNRQETIQTRQEEDASRDNGERSDALSRASQHSNRQVMQTREEKNAARDNGEQSDVVSRASTHPNPEAMTQTREEEEEDETRNRNESSPAKHVQIPKVAITRPPSVCSADIFKNKALLPRAVDVQVDNEQQIQLPSQPSEFSSRQRLEMSPVGKGETRNTLSFPHAERAPRVSPKPTNVFFADSFQHDTPISFEQNAVNSLALNIGTASSCYSFEQNKVSSQNLNTETESARFSFDQNAANSQTLDKGTEHSCYSFEKGAANSQTLKTGTESVRYNGPPHLAGLMPDAGLIPPMPSETPDFNDHQTVGNGRRPPPHHVVPGSMQTEGLNTATSNEENAKALHSFEHNATTSPWLQAETEWTPYYQAAISDQQSASAYYPAIRNQQSAYTDQEAISNQLSSSIYQAAMINQQSSSAYQAAISKDESSSIYHATINNRQSSNYRAAISNDQSSPTHQAAMSYQQSALTFQYQPALDADSDCQYLAELSSRLDEMQCRILSNHLLSVSTSPQLLSGSPNLLSVSPQLLSTSPQLLFGSPNPLSGSPQLLSTSPQQLHETQFALPWSPPRGRPRSRLDAALTGSGQQQDQGRTRREVNNRVDCERPCPSPRVPSAHRQHSRPWAAGGNISAVVNHKHGLSTPLKQEGHPCLLPKQQPLFSVNPPEVFTGTDSHFFIPSHGVQDIDEEEEEFSSHSPHMREDEIFRNYSQDHHRHNGGLGSETPYNVRDHNNNNSNRHRLGTFRQMSEPGHLHQYDSAETDGTAGTMTAQTRFKLNRQYSEPAGRLVLCPTPANSPAGRACGPSSVSSGLTSGLTSSGPTPLNSPASRASGYPTSYSNSLSSSFSNSSSSTNGFLTAGSSNDFLASSSNSLSGGSFSVNSLASSFPSRFSSKNGFSASSSNLSKNTMSNSLPSGLTGQRGVGVSAGGVGGWSQPPPPPPPPPPPGQRATEESVKTSRTSPHSGRGYSRPIKASPSRPQATSPREMMPLDPSAQRFRSYSSPHRAVLRSQSHVEASPRQGELQAAARHKFLRSFSEHTGDPRRLMEQLRTMPAARCARLLEQLQHMHDQAASYSGLDPRGNGDEKVALDTGRAGRHLSVRRVLFQDKEDLGASPEDVFERDDDVDEHDGPTPKPTPANTPTHTPTPTPTPTPARPQQRHPGTPYAGNREMDIRSRLSGSDARHREQQLHPQPPPLQPPPSQHREPALAQAPPPVQAPPPAQATPPAHNAALRQRVEVSIQEVWHDFLATPPTPSPSSSSASSSSSSSSPAQTAVWVTQAKEIQRLTQEASQLIAMLDDRDP